MRRPTIPIVLQLALLASGCNDFDPASLVLGLRVLGVKAEPPELASGEQATLRALVVLPPRLGDAGAPALTWRACHLAPAATSGDAVNPACLTDDADAGFLEPLGPGDTADETTVTMPAVASPLDFGLPDSTGGFYLAVRLGAALDGSRVESVYRLRYAAFGTPNHNPTLTGVFHVLGDDSNGDPGADAPTEPLAEDAPLPVHLGDQVRLRGGLTPDSVEDYETIVGDDLSDLMFSPATEQPRFLWYVSAGELSEDVTGLDQPDTVLTFGGNHPPSVGDTIDLWLVVHDDRGGTDWLHRTLQILQSP